MSRQLFRTRRGSKFWNADSLIEFLESRTLLSAVESASAQLQLISTTGSTASPVYHYGVALADTGSTNLGTLWFSWVPGEGFLPSSPTQISSPAGWAAQITDGPGGPGANGFSIQWTAQSAGAELTAGNSLSGFVFSSADSPSTIDGTSLGHAPTPVLTSTVYSGQPFSDAGDTFVVTGMTGPVAPSSTLTSTIVKSTIPSESVSGIKGKAAASADITNQTAAAIKGKTTVKLFATTDGAIDGSSILVGSVTRNLNIGAKASVSVPLKLNSALADLSAGTYTLLLQTVDPSAHSAESTTGPTVQVATPVISLTESFARLTLPASVAAGAKTHAVGVLQITNGGNVQSAGPTKISIFASADGSLDGTATSIEGITKTLHIASGESTTVSLALTKFPSVASGSYFIVAQVIDPKQHATSTRAGTVINVT